MRWTLPIALCLLAFTACGAPEFVSWEPASVRSNGTPIAKRAVQIGSDDIAAVRKAGGLPLGTLTMKGENMPEITSAAAVQAAEVGGTHFMVGKWDSSSSLDVWSFSGSSTSHEAHFVVIRVPSSGWHNLPAELTPQD